MLRLPNELWYVIASYSHPTELKNINILCCYIYVAIRDIIKQHYNPLLPLLYIYPDAPWHKSALVTNRCLPISYLLKQEYYTDAVYDRKYHVRSLPYSCMINIKMLESGHRVTFTTIVNKGILVEDFITHPHLFAPEHIATNQNMTLADIYHIDSLNIYNKKIINYAFMCPNLTYIDLIKLINDPDIVNDFYILSHNNFNR